MQGAAIKQTPYMEGKGMKHAIKPVEIRPDGMGGHMYDGYGKLKTALEMRRWEKGYKQRKRLKSISLAKLIIWLRENGYEILKQSSHELIIQAPGLFAKLFTEPQNTGLMAKYEITDYYGLCDDVLLDNETYILD